MVRETVIKKRDDFKKQSGGNKPKGEGSNETNSSAFTSQWLKLTGGGAGGLVKVFLGSTHAEVKAPAEDTSSSMETAQKHIIKVAAYSAVMPTPPERGAERGHVHEPGKEVTSRVKTDIVPSVIVIPGPAGSRKCIKVLKSYRIVLLGEAGAGKSSLGNNIFGENVFKIGQTHKHQVEAKSVHRRRITLVDTPGFDGTAGPEPDLKGEILKGITKCSPGPHVFLIVLKVEKKFTDQKKAVIEKISQLFSEEASKYAAVVFTHGDKLHEGMIRKFVDENKCLSDLVKKCSGRYHVVDNSCGKNKDQNQVQISQLLDTIEKVVMRNIGGCYTDKLAEKRKTENTSVGKVPQDETDKKANNSSSSNMWIKLSGPAGDAVAKALFGSTAGAVWKIAEKDVEKEDGESSSGAEKEESGEQERDAETEAEKGEEAETTSKTAEDTTGHEEGPAKKARRASKEKTRAGSAPGAMQSLFRALSSLFGAISSLFGAIPSLFGAILSAVRPILSAAEAILPAAGQMGSTDLATRSAVSAMRSKEALQFFGGAAAAGVAGTAAWGITKIISKIQWFIEKMKQLWGLLTDLKQNSRVVLLVVAFYLLLALTFYAKVPVTGNILLSLLILAVFLLIVALFSVI